MAEHEVAMISSTVRDIPEHREVVRDACLSQRIMPSMMEYWPALDEDGISASLQKVDEATIYIGVFGHRYGYVPKGKDCSITEMEYDRAVQRGIPRLLFLMDADHPLKISQIEIKAADRLQQLKERLMQERTVVFFKSAQDLKVKVVHSLSHYILSKISGSTPHAEAAPLRSPVFDPRNYVFFVPFRPKGQQVVGRDAAIKAVRAQLVSGHRTAIGQTASFQGLGGLGKTQLAVEYAHLYRDEYPNGVIWLSADQDIEAQLIKIAEKSMWLAAESTPQDKLAVARQRLRTYSHCLIVFDDLQKPGVIRDYLPEPEAEPHILVTSRFDQPDFVPVPLELLDLDLSLQLLTQEAGQSPANEEELKAAKEISEKLGGLPLALELAGAYLRHRPLGWIRYRDLLNQNLKAALPGKLLRGSFTRHEADLYSTLKLNEDALTEEPLLREILDVLTWSGPSAMGESLLCAVLDVKEPSKIAGALSLGVALRLLRKTPGAENYALHRLVCEVRREDTPLAPRKEWTIRACESLANWFQTRKRDFSDLPRFEAEFEHLHAWHQNVQSLAPELAARLIWLQAYPPFHRGHYQDSLARLQTSRALLGPNEDHDLQLRANILTDLCTINVQLGQYGEAKKCGREALDLRMKLLGEHNSETAMSFHNLAAALKALEENEESLKHQEKALAIWREIHGEDHINTALALDGVSASYRAAGKNKEALEIAERALAIREKVLGHLHPDTAISFSNVGNVSAALGDHARALQCEEKALAIASELFGIRSPIKARVLNNLAVVHHGLRDWRKAAEFALQALTMRRELFGEQHPDTLTIAVELTAIWCESGRVRQGFQLIDDFLKKLPKDNPRYEWLKDQNQSFHRRFLLPGFRQPPARRR